MKGAIALRNPTGVLAALDTSSTNVTSAAYVDFVTAANMTYAASGMLIHNPGSQPIKLAKGAAGQEVDLLTIPVGEAVMIPINLKKSERLSVRSQGATQSSGIITASFYQ